MDGPIERPVSWKTLYLDWRAVGKYCGPGIVMSLAFIDPGNLVADIQNGAYTKFDSLWLMFWSTALIFYMQTLASDIGVCSGKGLGSHCRYNMSGPVKNSIWIMMEICLIGSDIQKVLASSMALQMLFQLDLLYGCLIISAFDFIVFWTLLLKYSWTIQMCFLGIIISTMCVTFSVLSFQSQPDAAEVIVGIVVPQIPSYAVLGMVASLGSVASPYNLYMNSHMTAEQCTIDTSNHKWIKEMKKYLRVEAVFSLLVAFLINIMIAIPFAQTYFNKDCAEAAEGPFGYQPPGTDQCELMVENSTLCCAEVGLADLANDSFSKYLGDSGNYLFAIGLLASGQASTISVTASGQALIHGFHQRKWNPLRRQTFMRCFSLGPAILLATSPSSPDVFIQLLNCLQGLLLSIALTPLVRFSTDEEIMGSYRIGNIHATFLTFLNILCIGVSFWPMYVEYPQEWQTALISVFLATILTLNVFMYISNKQGKVVKLDAKQSDEIMVPQ